jgi:hypothetical protein
MGQEVVKFEGVAEHLRFASSLNKREQLEYVAKHFQDKSVLFDAVKRRSLGYSASRSRPEIAAVDLYLWDAVARYSEMVRQRVDSKYRYQVAAAHGALDWLGNQRLGDIAFYSTLDGSKLAYVPVDLELGKTDVEFIFGKSAQEVANEIVGVVVSAAKPQISA